MKPILPVALLVAATGFTAQPTHGQVAPIADPLIAAVESMKHSIARLVCTNGVQSRTPTVLGSAFFVSSSGTFLTAAHVFSEIKVQPELCRFAAVVVPTDAWNPQIREEFQAWFEFRPSDCRVDADLDVARCRTIDDLSERTNGMAFSIRAAPIELSSPPDGAVVGIIGFPLGVRDPLTSRAAVSTSRVVWREDKRYAELLLDRPSWPGSSGSPVFLSDGRVVGIVVGTGSGDTTGMTVARPGSSFKDLLVDP